MYIYLNWGEGPLSKCIRKKTPLTAVASREGTRGQGGWRETVHLLFLFGQFVF